MAHLAVRNIHKRFDRTEVLRGVDLEIAHGEFISLVGPSGCGKSTLLRIVAGLEAQTEGDVVIGERNVNGIKASQRDLAMVFQSYALYPHLSVFDNIAVPLRMRHLNAWQRLPGAAWIAPGARRTSRRTRRTAARVARPTCARARSSQTGWARASPPPGRRDGASTSATAAATSARR